jgi:hypothetical protein
MIVKSLNVDEINTAYEQQVPSSGDQSYRMIEIKYQCCRACS